MGLTVLYAGLALGLIFGLPTKCVEDDASTTCQSEGVDNSVLQWSSSFMIALCMIGFAMNLTCCMGDMKQDVRRSGVLAQIFMGTAYAALGIGHILYPNSGLDDNVGMLGYWITTMGFAVFFAFSGWCTGQFGIEACEATSDEFRIGCSSERSNLLIVICQLLLSMSACAYLTGGIWCSVTPDLQTSGVSDTENGSIQLSSDDHVCFRIMYISNVALNMSYALLWIPVGVVFLGASRQWPYLVLGMSNPVAAVLGFLLQWSVGSMFVVYIAFATFLKGNEDGAATIDSFLNNWETTYGTVLYHWGMLITMYCLHNLSITLTDRDEDVEEDWWAVDWDWLQGMFGVQQGKSQKDKRSTKKENSGSSSWALDWDWLMGTSSDQKGHFPTDTRSTKEQKSRRSLSDNQLAHQGQSQKDMLSSKQGSSRWSVSDYNPLGENTQTEESQVSPAKEYDPSKDTDPTKQFIYTEEIIDC